MPVITGLNMHVLAPAVGFIEYRYVRMRLAKDSTMKTQVLTTHQN